MKHTATYNKIGQPAALAAVQSHAAELWVQLTDKERAFANRVYSQLAQPLDNDPNNLDYSDLCMLCDQMQNSVDKRT